MTSSMPWRPNVPGDYRGPRIALIHGFMAGVHMQWHLLRFLREHGFADTTLYSNHLRPASIAKDLAPAAQAGRPIVLLGYSQGGIQVMKVAKLLKAQQVKCDLVISLAAGGIGRWHPAQWGFNGRRVPANVSRYLNYFAANDKLGTDRRKADNLAHATSDNTRLENIAYSEAAGVDHLSIARCYPAERVLPEVKALFLDRLLNELAELSS